MLNEKQLKMFEDILLEKKELLLSGTEMSQNIIQELRCESFSDDLDFAEISSDTHNLNTLRNKQLQELKEIDLALVKIKNKTYGTCEMCDDKIGIQRLRVKPHARFCIECRENYEKELNK